jgi:hypothetical protein
MLVKNTERIRRLWRSHCKKYGYKPQSNINKGFLILTVKNEYHASIQLWLDYIDIRIMHSNNNHNTQDNYRKMFYEFFDELVAMKGQDDD